MLTKDMVETLYTQLFPAVRGDVHNVLALNQLRNIAMCAIDDRERFIMKVAEAIGNASRATPPLSEYVGKLHVLRGGKNGDDTLV